ncbi:MAG: hypothetical protein F7B59_02770, partial [Desulfurococcales archaeon]|nr:hypothetical protein [Desulfurococcales archaeon]
IPCSLGGDTLPMPAYYLPRINVGEYVFIDYTSIEMYNSHHIRFVLYESDNRIRMVWERFGGRYWHPGKSRNGYC